MAAMVSNVLVLVTDFVLGLVLGLVLENLLQTRLPVRDPALQTRVRRARVGPLQQARLQLHLPDGTGRRDARKRERGGQPVSGQRQLVSRRSCKRRSQLDSTGGRSVTDSTGKLRPLLHTRLE